MLTRKLVVGVAAAAVLTACAQTTAPATHNTDPTVTSTEVQTVTAPPTETSQPADPAETESTATQDGEPSSDAAGQPTWDQVPVADDFTYPDYPTPMSNEDFEGPGQAAVGLCDPGEYSDPTTMLVRSFTYDETGESGPQAVVFGYDSTEAATAAYDALLQAANDCATQLEEMPLENPSVHHHDEIVFDSSHIDAETARADYLMASGSIPDEDMGWFNATTLVQADNRVAWLVEPVQGQDYNCSILADDESIGQCPVLANLESVAQRLAEDA